MMFDTSQDLWDLEWNLKTLRFVNAFRRFRHVHFPWLLLRAGDRRACAGFKREHAAPPHPSTSPAPIILPLAQTLVPPCPLAPSPAPWPSVPPHPPTRNSNNTERAVCGN